MLLTILCGYGAIWCNSYQIGLSRRESAEAAVYAVAELRTSGSLRALQTTGAELEATQMLLLLVWDEMNKGDLANW